MKDWRENSDLSTYEKRFDALMELSEKNAPYLLDWLSWWHDRMFRWHKGLQGDAPNASLAESAFGNQTTLYGNGNNFIKCISIFGYAASKLRQFLLRLHNDCLSVTDSARLNASAFRQLTRSAFRQQLANSQAQANLTIPSSNITIPASLAREIAISNGLQKFLDRIPSETRQPSFSNNMSSTTSTTISSSTVSESSDSSSNNSLVLLSSNLRRHEENRSISCLCVQCVTLCIPINSTPAEKRKRGTPKKLHALTESSLKILLSRENSLPNIIHADRENMIFTVEDSRVSVPACRIEIEVDKAASETDRTIAKRGLNCTCPFYQSFSQPKKSAFPLCLHTLLILVKVFGLEPTDPSILLGSISEARFRTMLQSRQPDHPIWRSPNSPGVSSNAICLDSLAPVNELPPPNERITVQFLKTRRSICFSCRTEIGVDLALEFPCHKIQNRSSQSCPPTAKGFVHFNSQCIRATNSSPRTDMIPLESVRMFDISTSYVVIEKSLFQSLNAAFVQILLASEFKIAVIGDASVRELVRARKTKRVRSQKPKNTDGNQTPTSKRARGRPRKTPQDPQETTHCDSPPDIRSQTNSVMRHKYDPNEETHIHISPIGY